jgi:multiple sugar transport system ATP-binding protein
MNFLHGATVDGGTAFEGGGIKISLDGYDGGAVGARAKAILGLRPEHLEIVDAAIPGQTLPATVEIDEPMGADSLVWLRVGDVPVSVRVPVEDRPEHGKAVHLKVDIAKASVFDAGSEQRI